jgi:hypothetical protein
VRAVAGGLAVLFGFRGADRYLAAVLSAGQAVTIYEQGEAGPRALAGCQSQVVSPEQLAPVEPERAVEVTLAFAADGGIVAGIDGEELARCPAPQDVSRADGLAGAVGIGVTGAAGAQLRVDLFAAER